MSKFNTQNKETIRSLWAKPIIDYIYQVLGKKLLYLGLPDINAYDIKEWLEYIDTVYAFQCREYPHPSDPNQNRDKVLALEDTLRTFERKKKLTTFDVFDGYIEEVILRGFDNSPTTKEFTQQNIITLYNLDFCGQVTSPIEYKDRKGNLQKAYKFDAIKRLLDLQEQITFPNKKFIMFLTVHCSYSGQELNDFVSSPPNTDIQNYLNQLKSFSKGKKSPFVVKAFVFHFLQQFFSHNNFVAEILPPIYYLGDNNHPILFFTILGTNTNNRGAGGVVHSQKLNDALNIPFIEVANNSFHKSNTISLSKDLAIDGDINPIHLFKNTKAYKNLWETLQ